MATTYEPIATTTLGSAAASITFSSIAASWTDLRIIFTGSASSANNNVNMRFNSDTGSNYSLTEMNGNGSTASSYRATSQTSITANAMGNSTTIPCTLTADIFSYAGSTFKTILVASAADMNGSGYVERVVGLWRSTSAINTVLLYPYSGYFNAGTTATLYGIKAA